MPNTPTILILSMIFVALYLLSAIKVINEYERGVVFRLGRLLAHRRCWWRSIATAPLPWG